MKEKLIVYRGKKFTLEWYFNDQGKSAVREYYETLPFARKKKAAQLFTLLGDSGKIFNTEKFRSEEDQIYAFKPSPDRFLCFFFEGAKVIITSAYEKKTSKLPAKEKQMALKAKADYIKRCKQGNYYD